MTTEAKTKPTESAQIYRVEFVRRLDDKWLAIVSRDGLQVRHKRLDNYPHDTLEHAVTSFIVSLHDMDKDAE